MSLIDETKKVCDRLASRGWRDLLMAVSGNDLDIKQTSAAKLRTALSATIPEIDRTRPGFEDFHSAGERAIAAGNPSRSLLFHAFASPDVHPTADGKPSANQSDYPTIAELDVLENYIYSRAANRTDLSDTFVAVFAYQYRVASRTSHRRHADMAYSRTGIARVGTADFNYDASRRSFWVIPDAGGDKLAVLPARYAVFLARRDKPGSAGSVQGGNSGPNNKDYVFPVHKLFIGRECLKNRNLKIDFLEFHRNEKLRKIHQLPVSNGGIQVPPGFDISKKPYVRDSINGGNLASLQKVGSSTLVIPNPGAKLVRTVVQKNTADNADRLVHFVVPALKTSQSGRPINRFTESTLEIPRDGADRLAPEFVNIRHQVNPNGSATQTPRDLNNLSASDFSRAMNGGGYAAAHFTDDSCDGCVEAVVTGLAAQTENLPAFSLITAPDFFPLADQIEVETETNINQVKPLSKGDLPVNLTLPRSSDPTSFAFDENDKTVTAIVGDFSGRPAVPIEGKPNRMVSFLPDAASDVFAPGWDTSRSRNTLSAFLTTSGLGSPFPEDAKLCAALASFWPAVAPDNGRTFGNLRMFGNQLPMLDEELGFHPDHEIVTSGQSISFRGWDGEFGPFFETVSGKGNVNFVEIERSDYVSQALANRIRVSLTAEVQSGELIARNRALRLCESINRIISKPDHCLVVFRKIDDWASAGRGRPELRGNGHLLEFAELTGGVKKVRGEIPRVRRAVRKKHIFQVGVNGVAYKNGNAGFKFER